MSDKPIDSSAAPDDSLVGLLLWLTAANDEQSKARLSELGVSGEELKQLRRDNPRQYKRMRKLRVCAEMLDRPEIAGLICGRLGESIMGCAEPRGLSALVSAAAKLPAWVFGEAEAQQRGAFTGLLQAVAGAAG